MPSSKNKKQTDSIPCPPWVYKLTGKMSLEFFIKGSTRCRSKQLPLSAPFSFAIKQSTRTWYKLTQGNHKECSNNHRHLSSQTLVPDCLYYPGQKFIFLSFSSKKGAFIHIFEKYKYYIWWLWAQCLFPLYLCSPKISFVSLITHEQHFAFLFQIF